MIKPRGLTDHINTVDENTDIGIYKWAEGIQPDPEDERCIFVTLIPDSKNEIQIANRDTKNILGVTYPNKLPREQSLLLPGRVIVIKKGPAWVKGAKNIRPTHTSRKGYIDFNHSFWISSEYCLVGDNGYGRPDDNLIWYNRPSFKILRPSSYDSYDYVEIMLT